MNACCASPRLSPGGTVSFGLFDGHYESVASANVTRVILLAIFMNTPGLQTVIEEQAKRDAPGMRRP
jgi:hypothetical protein